MFDYISVLLKKGKLLNVKISTHRVMRPIEIHKQKTPGDRGLML